LGGKDSHVQRDSWTSQVLDAQANQNVARFLDG
jgi:hypothetical protein